MAVTPRKRSAAGAGGRSSAGAAEPGDGAVVPAVEELPGKAEIAAAAAEVRRFMLDVRHARVRDFLERFADAPPQVLLLEGGTSPERLAAANYWILLLNCTERKPISRASGAGFPDFSGQPCLDCPTCIRMLTHLHRDCFYFDGEAGSIKIDEVRALRSVLGEPPREARFRTVIFREAQALVEAAANALLKSFEEPRPGTSFIMLTPQRERLLPTLVSRSVVLTLAWPSCQSESERERLLPWEAALCSFLRTGRGFFEQSSVKGTVDAGLVHAVCNLCRRALVRTMGGKDSGGEEDGLASLMAGMPAPRLRMLDEALAECQDSLILGVNPSLVLEWLATRMYFLMPRG